MRRTATTTSHHAAAPAACRTGMTSGDNPGTNEVTVASVPVRVLRGLDGDDEADHQQQRRRRDDAAQVLLPADQRRRGGEHRRVEGVAEHEPGARTVTTVPISRPGSVDDVEGQRPGDADHRDDQHLRQPEQPEPEDLAGQQLPRPHRRQQQLHHPAGLLLDHALGDELAEEDQQAVQHHHADQGDDRGLGVGVARSGSSATTSTSRRGLQRDAGRRPAAGSTDSRCSAVCTSVSACPPVALHEQLGPVAGRAEQRGVDVAVLAPRRGRGLVVVAVTVDVGAERPRPAPAAPSVTAALPPTTPIRWCRCRC